MMNLYVRFLVWLCGYLHWFFVTKKVRARTDEIVQELFPGGMMNTKRLSTGEIYLLQKADHVVYKSKGLWWIVPPNHPNRPYMQVKV